MKLLIDEPPLQVLPTLARRIGLNGAITLQQLHYRQRLSQDEHDGRSWVTKTVEEWQVEFPFWSISTITRNFGELRKHGQVFAKQFSASTWKHVLSYSVNYEALAALEIGDKTDLVNLTKSTQSNRRDRACQNDKIEDSEITKSHLVNLTKSNQSDIQNLKDKSICKSLREAEDTSAAPTDLGELKPTPEVAPMPHAKGRELSTEAKKLIANPLCVAESLVRSVAAVDPDRVLDIAHHVKKKHSSDTTKQASLAAWLLRHPDEAVPRSPRRSLPVPVAPAATAKRPSRPPPMTDEERHQLREELAAANPAMAVMYRSKRQEAAAIAVGTSSLP